MTVKSGLKSFLRSQFCEYETVKVVQVKSTFLGITSKVIQCAAIVYVVFYMFIMNHGYQFIDSAPTSATTTKLKGVALAKSTKNRTGVKLWDIIDLVQPPQQNGAFFVITKVLITNNQTQSICEAAAKWKGNCTTDLDCLPKGKLYHLGNGMSTGICSKVTNTCIVDAWCPIENEDSGEELLFDSTKNFTVYIKNHVKFPHYRKKRSNIIESINQESMQNCTYHPKNDPYCPIFRLGDIVSLAETNEKEGTVLDDRFYDKMAQTGGVISITIQWDCDFDFHESKCKPTYVFDRLDSAESTNSMVSGFNYRYPEYYMEDNLWKRKQTKAFGILFIVNTEAKARAFELITFLQNLGSGIGLLAIASFFCDIIMVNIHKKRSFFKGFIFQKAVSNDKSNQDGSPDQKVSILISESDGVNDSKT